MDVFIARVHFMKNKEIKRACGLIALFLYVVTGITTVPDTTVAEVGTVAGKQNVEIEVFFFGASHWLIDRYRYVLL